MKKILNIILYVIFLALLRLPGIMKDYMAVHMEFFQYAAYILPAIVVLGTLILLIRPKLVSPDLPLPDLLLQILFIIATLVLFIWQYVRVSYLVLALLTEDVYTLIALLVRKRRRTPPEEPITG
jgi:hypothetical protein